MIAFRLATVCLASGLGMAPAVCAQEAGASPADEVEAYLERLDLPELLAAHLETRLRESPASERLPIAERLADVYVDLLAGATSSEARGLWESKSRDLLALVPQSELASLRLKLVAVVYSQAEETIERGRLRLAEPEEVEEAIETMRAVEPRLREIATRAHQETERLEREESRGEADDALYDRLRESRALRSRAFFFHAWCLYYQAEAGGARNAASEAMRSFGWLLNSRGGNIASLERLPQSTLRLDHVARAAIGCGLCEGVRGNHEEAMRWFRTVDEAEGFPEALREQLLSRQVWVLARSKRWADLELHVRRARGGDRFGRERSTPLPSGVARLLVVLSLEAGRAQGSGSTLEQLGRIGLADLVAGQEIAQVLDLVRRYGTSLLGERGFVVRYVRALDAYERAREAHRASEESLDKPSVEPSVRDAYTQAARAFGLAAREPDAGEFAEQAARAWFLEGLAMYYAGQAKEAAARFTEASERSTDRTASEEALWMAIVAWDLAAEEGVERAEESRDQAAALFLRNHADSPRAATLLLRRATSGLMSDEEAASILLSVPEGSAVYEASRRHAAQALYRLYLGSSGSERDFAAQRFAGVGEQILAIDRRIVQARRGEESAKAAGSARTLSRQLLDALLSVSAPDARRAESVLETLRGIAVVASIDLGPYEDELLFRELQIALAKSDQEAATRITEELLPRSNRYATAGVRLLFVRARDRWQAGDVTARAEVIRLGREAINRYGAQGMGIEAAVMLGLHDIVARAAFESWEQESDRDALRVSVELDRRVLEARPTSRATLRRVGIGAEARGERELALECWTTLAAGLETLSEAWYEAKYNAIRLLADSDRGAGATALRQLFVLHPETPPEPWDKELDALAYRLGVERVVDGEVAP